MLWLTRGMPPSGVCTYPPQTAQSGPTSHGRPYSSCGVFLQSHPGMRRWAILFEACISQHKRPCRQATNKFIVLSPNFDLHIWHGRVCLGFEL